MVGRMGGGLHSLVEIELKMAKLPAFTNPKSVMVIFGSHSLSPVLSSVSHSYDHLVCEKDPCPLDSRT